MGLPFPPLEDPAFAGSYTQIPLNANTPLTPYADLGASNAYGRALIYPDDIIPTNGLVTLFGKSPPNLLRDSHHDGAADVWVVNQSGGGGGSAPFPAVDTGGYVNKTLGSSTVDVATWSTNAGAKYIFGVSFAVSVTGAGLSSAQFEQAEVVLRDSTNIVRLAQLNFWFAGGGATPTPPFQSIDRMFPWPVDVFASCPDPPGSIKITIFSGSWALNGSVMLLVGS